MSKREGSSGSKMFTVNDDPFPSGRYGSKDFK